MQNGSNATQQQNQDSFKHATHYSDNTFHECHGQVKANKPTHFKPCKPLTFHPNQEQIAYNVVNEPFKRDYDNQIGKLIKMPNFISEKIE